MSRRDTIIVAVLVNAALLMILFATAVRSDDVEKRPSATSNQLAEATQSDSSSSDALFNPYVTSVPTLAEKEQGDILLDEVAMTFPAPTTSVEEESLPQKKTEFPCVNVTVKKGDFLEKIAQANNTTVAAIMKANNMSSTQLKVGQVLKVPLSEGQKTEKKSPISSEGEYYIVKEGDNPWLIASRNKINLEELLKINNLDDQKAKRLRPGDKLRIR